MSLYPYPPSPGSNVAHLVTVAHPIAQSHDVDRRSASHRNGVWTANLHFDRMHAWCVVAWSLVVLPPFLPALTPRHCIEGVFACWLITWRVSCPSHTQFIVVRNRQVERRSSLLRRVKTDALEVKIQCRRHERTHVQALRNGVNRRYKRGSLTVATTLNANGGVAERPPQYK